MVLPDPDSPTTAKVSPGRTASETSSTTAKVPVSLGNAVLRPFTSRIYSDCELTFAMELKHPGASVAAHLWIQGVA